MSDSTPQPSVNSVLYPRSLKFLAGNLRSLVRERPWRRVLVGMIRGVLAGIVIGPIAYIDSQAISSALASAPLTSSAQPYGIVAGGVHDRGALGNDARTTGGIRAVGAIDCQARLILPLDATININGTARYQGIAALLLAQVFGVKDRWQTQSTVLPCPGWDSGSIRRRSWQEQETERC